MPHDIIIAGGGIAGSTLGIIMARAGASVLVLEKEQRHRDRIRGEGVHPWGVIEARAAGILDTLLERCAVQIPVLERYTDGALTGSRDLVETTPSHDAMLTFYHPEMQETLNEAAREAGVEILRAAQVVDVSPGHPPVVTYTHEGETQCMSARLVVGADGRRSKARSLAGFNVTRDPDRLLMCGVLVSGMALDESASQILSTSGGAGMVQFIPLGQGRHRFYHVSGDRQRHPPIGGRSGVERLFSYAHDCRVPRAWLDSMSIIGPLATFEGAHWWVDHPYRDIAMASC